MSTYAELIEKTSYLTLATVDSDGQPWNTPVYGAYDSEGNFFWGSHVESQHSTNIRNNPKVFIVIYDSTAPAGDGEGAYVQAIAHELTDEAEIATAHNLIQTRRPIAYWKLDEVLGSSPVRLYRATPINKWLNADGEKDGVYIDARVEVKV